ncbi:MAG: winged helix-turn-helix domain-containing protein, partial [Aliidongia sp.]
MPAPTSVSNLTRRAFDVLRYLVEHSGRLVTHDELLTALWRDVHVQPEVLKSYILAIRNALGGQEFQSPVHRDPARPWLPLYRADQLSCDATALGFA